MSHINLKLLENKIDSIYHELSSLTNSTTDKKRKKELKKQLAYILQKLSHRKLNTKKAEAQKFKTLIARETKDLVKETKYDEMIRRMKHDLQKQVEVALEHAVANPHDENAQQQLIQAQDAMQAIDNGVAQGQPVAIIQQAVKEQEYKFNPKSKRWTQLGKKGFIKASDVPEDILKAHEQKQAEVLEQNEQELEQKEDKPQKKKKVKKISLKKPQSSDSDEDFSGDVDPDIAKVLKLKKSMFPKHLSPIPRHNSDTDGEQFHSADEIEPLKLVHGSGFLSDALKKVGSVLGSIGKPIFESMPALKPFEGLLGENSLYSQVGNLAESAGLGRYPTHRPHIPRPNAVVDDYTRQERILKNIYEDSKRRAIQALINEELENQQLSQQEVSDKQSGYYQLAYTKLLKELRDLREENQRNE